MKTGKYSIMALAASLLLGACSADQIDSPSNGETKRLILKFGKGGSDALTQNTMLYQFHDVVKGNGAYVKKPELTMTGDHSLTFTLGEGRWYFALVSGMTSNVTDHIIEPVYGKKPEECVMFRNDFRDENGGLAQMPEIYTAFIKGVELSGKWVIDDLTNVDHFEPDKDYNYPAQYTRNLAKVKVIFEKSEYLDVTALQNIEISNVPSTLSWDGTLYPSKYKPEISKTPLKGKIPLMPVEGEDGKMTGAEELSFLIPAHRGTDYASPSTAVDTTTSLLHLNVDLICDDGSHVVKRDIELLRAPRMNGVYEVRVSYNKRQLNVSTEIIPWIDENMNADIANRTIVTDKGEVGMAWKDTIRVQCKDTYTVTKAADATWLTVKDLGGNAYELTANVDTYVDNHPRSSYVSITTGNLEKRIPVTQRPDKGTINVHLQDQPTVKEMWLSPPHNQKEVTVTCTGGNWKMLDNLKTASVSGNAGVTNNVKMTRKPDADIYAEDFANAYGRGPVVFKNMRTLDTDTIFVDNLFIGARDEVIEIAQPTSRNDTITTTTDVAVYGGVKDVVIKSLPSFIGSSGTFFDKTTGVFTFRSIRHPTGEDQWGDIVLGHKSDPDYTVKLPIDQAILVVIPEFDYFVVKFTWASADVDIKCGFAGNPTSVVYRDKTFNTSAVSQLNNKFVGWHQSSNTSFAGKRVLTWGGDATGGQGETVYFNAREINTYPYPGKKGVATNAKNLIPRTLDLSLAAGWYTGGASGNITCTIYCYLGGTMNQSGTNFNNSGGKTVFQATKTFYIRSGLTKPSGSYLRFCIITYDRKKHSANIKWDGSTIV